MLHRDVVEAVEKNKFKIYAVDSVDQVMELLTGKSAGVASKKGDFSRKTINGLVQMRLNEMNRTRKNFSKSSGKDEDEK